MAGAGLGLSAAWTRLRAARRRRRLGSWVWGPGARHVGAVRRRGGEAGGGRSGSDRVTAGLFLSVTGFSPFPVRVSGWPT